MTNLMCREDFAAGMWVSQNLSGSTTASGGVLTCTGATAYRYTCYHVGAGDVLEVDIVAKSNVASGTAISLCTESLATVVQTVVLPASTDYVQHKLRYTAPVGGGSVLVLLKIGNDSASAGAVSKFFDPSVRIVGGGAFGSYRVLAAGMVRATETVTPELSATFTNFGVYSVLAEDATTFRVTLNHVYGNYGASLGNTRPLMFCSITGDGSPAKVATIGNFSVDAEGRAYCFIRAYAVTTGAAVPLWPPPSGQSVFISFMILAP